MNIGYWILAGLAALIFAAAGGMKLARPLVALRESGMAWVDDFTAGTVKLIGALEILGALGLILPALTGTAVVLSPIAGAALTVLMAAAVVVHLRRRETPGPAAVLAVIAAAAAVLGFAAF